MANRIPKQAVLWFFFSFFIFLLGNNNHGVWDRDEPRYCEATREMVATGDWIVPRFNGNLRYDKPVLTYWLMAPSMMTFGMNEFGARFPAAMAAAVRTTAVFLLALAMGASLRGAWIAAAGSVTMALLFFVSKAATTDSVLILTVTIAMAMLWMRIKDGFRWSTHLTFWGALALSTLVKGPVGPAFVFLAWLSWHGWNRLRPDVRDAFDGSYFSAPMAGHREPWALRLAAGVGLFLLIALPWAIAVSIKTEGDFLRVSFGKHVVGRITTEPTNHHVGPIFYYLLTMIPSLFPLVGLALPALDWSRRLFSTAQVRFLYCWFVPGFIVVSLATTKLPHYPAPLYVAMCLLMGLFWTATEQGLTLANWRVERWLRAVGAGFVALVGPGLLVATSIGFDRVGLDVPRLPFMLVGLSFTVGGIVAFVAWMKRQDLLAAKSWGISWLLAIIVTMLWALPTLDAQRPSKALAEVLHESFDAKTRVIAVEYQEPSLVFYWGNGITMASKNTNKDKSATSENQLDRAGAMAMLNDASQPTALVTTADRWAKYEREYREDDGGTLLPHVRVIHEGRYFQFEKGRFIDMVIVANGEPRGGAKP